MYCDIADILRTWWMYA